jgi:hypothetical protein
VAFFPDADGMGLYTRKLLQLFNRIVAHYPSFKPDKQVIP